VHGKALVGYPLLALATVQFTDASACTWQWFRSSTAVSSPRNRKAVTVWLPVSADGPRYVPTAADEGCMLRVTCRPPPADSDTVRPSALGLLPWLTGTREVKAPRTRALSKALPTRRPHVALM